VRVHTAEFVRSAASAQDFPRDPVPQVALVGRSNVGKSSLINALTGRAIAKTSAAAGKTRLVNVYRVGLDGFSPGLLYLIDLPGYGYARGGAPSAATFEVLTSTYFACPSWDEASQRGQPLGPSAAIQVVDARHPGLQADLQAWGWLTGQQQRPVAVVASKVDKLSRAERERSLRQWQAALTVPILPVSAATGEGLNELWQAISRLLETTRP
jgi:GTP-binding protein